MEIDPRTSKGRGFYDAEGIAFPKIGTEKVIFSAVTVIVTERTNTAILSYRGK